MPRQARLDAPNTLHMMGRGLGRRAISRYETDRANFVEIIVASYRAEQTKQHLAVQRRTKPLGKE